MKKLALITAVALAIAACGTDASNTFDPEGGFSQGSEGELRALAYAYQPDSRLVYGFTMDMDMEMSSDFPGGGDFGDMAMNVDMGGTIGYDVRPGPEEGTVVITIDGTLSEFNMSEFTVDGESMPSELSGFDDPEAIGAGEVIPAMTVTLDARGDILEMQVGDLAVPSELLNSFGSFNDPSGMSLTGSLFGPELPIDEVRIGATWTTADTQEIPFIGEFTVVTNHEIVGEETRDGRDTIVIESVASMSPLQMTLSDMVEAIQEETELLGSLGMSDDELATFATDADFLEAFGVDFEMDIRYEDAITTTWLDHTAGIMVATTGSVNTIMKMTMETPDGDGSMDMKMDMRMNTLLIEDGASV